ncbi:hypothetical protein BHE74_00018192 [Ensete ventricosum]|nr:hypothetical protein BHE74_00018192 [Ensete ventricosum]
MLAHHSSNNITNGDHPDHTVVVNHRDVPDAVIYQQRRPQHIDVTLYNHYVYATNDQYSIILNTRAKEMDKFEQVAARSYLLSHDVSNFSRFGRSSLDNDLSEII